MTSRIQKLLISCVFLAIVVGLASCGSSGIGAIPSGTPDHGNGTPAVIPTQTVSPAPVMTAPPSALGTSYAFVRNDQLWVARNGAKPVQVTHFNYKNAPNVFWRLPAWSPDDHFIAFIMNARPAGVGGGGCPAPDFGANGALYVLNTGTMQLTQLLVPADSADPIAKSPEGGYWQYVFWENSTHLLAWYNGVMGKTSRAAGLYRYDAISGSLAQVIPLSALGAATLFAAQNNVPLLLSMRYSNEQLFYQVIVHPFGRQSQFVIYRHSVIQPGLVSSKVISQGTEPWCAAQGSGPYIKPGWDVSADGQQLAAQMVTASGPDQALGSIQVLNLKDGVTASLLNQLPARMLTRDDTLSWGPDSQTLVAAEYHMQSQDGPYSASLANPVAMQKYAPAQAGEVSWKPDSSAFALQDQDAADAGDSIGPYLFETGEAQGQLLMKDAQDFVWG
ncbi:MAG TPA: hypothetical protein VFA09_04390 [Ktedonobacteraceae bacterium]|nr:hypothetical protein [Ktedonobacteraceae bacterium]